MSQDNRTNGQRVAEGGLLALSHVKQNYKTGECSCELCQYAPHIVAHATAEIIAELEGLLKNIKDYESDTEGGDETWFEYIDPQVIEDRIKYYKAKETQ